MPGPPRGHSGESGGWQGRAGRGEGGEGVFICWVSISAALASWIARREETSLGLAALIAGANEFASGIIGLRYVNLSKECSARHKTKFLLLEKGLPGLCRLYDHSRVQLVTIFASAKCFVFIIKQEVESQWD